MVRIFARGILVKIHPRQQPGRRSTDPEDLRAEMTVYAMRDLARLQSMAAGQGPAIGAYATAPLDVPVPWTRIRRPRSTAPDFCRTGRYPGGTLNRADE
jgi:hypothetical protein